MGPYLSTPITKKNTYETEKSKIRLTQTEMQGWKRTMEDHSQIDLDLSPESMYFAVFDGHGGPEISKFLSLHFSEELKGNRSFINKNYEQGLRETFLLMDDLIKSEKGTEEIIRIARDLPINQPVYSDFSRLYAGSTACIGLLLNDRIIVANVGDTRCALYRNKNWVELSSAHRADSEREKQRIHAAGGFIENNRVMGSLTSSRSLGDFELKKNSFLGKKQQILIPHPSVKNEKLNGNEDFFVMASDGVWDILDFHEIGGIVYGGLESERSLSEISEEILDKCVAGDVENSGGLGCDNMSLILVQFKTSTQ